jgi:hypothetical protein
MRQLLIINILIFLWICCGHDQRNIQMNEGITLIDTVPSSIILDDTKALESGRFFSIFYLGKQTNPIILNREPLFDQNMVPFSCWGQPISDTLYSTNKTHFSAISVKIHDEFKLGKEIKFVHFERPNKQILDSVHVFKSLPLFIYNNSNRQFNLCDISKIVLQSKVNNSWKDIRIFNNYCYPHEPHIVIPGQNLVIAKYPCYSGDTLIACRIKLVGFKDSCFSNDFKYFVDKWRIDIR